MEILFLGTGAAEGWPGVFCKCESCNRARKEGGKNLRSRSAILIDREFLVDIPPDLYIKSILYGINLGDVRTLFVTHSHQDHFSYLELNMRKPPFAYLPEGLLDIYGNPTVIEIIENNVDCKEAMINTHIIRPFESLEKENFTITALSADHTLNEESLLYMIKIGNRSIFYGHDSGWYPDKTLEYLFNNHIDIGIFDCTYGPSADKRYHMGIPAIAELKNLLERAGSIGRDSICIATHFSHNGGLLHKELEEILNPKGFIVAYDGMRLEI
jgi:phosphoribosyl 1,2-cyclic phosphate phosphodiesterase